MVSDAYNVTYEKQSMPTSCAAKTAQMVMNYWDPEAAPLGQEKEKEIFSQARLGVYDVATHTGIALYALNQEFEVTHIVCGPELYRYPENITSEKMSREEFDKKISIDVAFNKSAEAKGLKHVFVQNIDKDALCNLLEKGPVICMTQNLQSKVLHDVIVTGFKDNAFSIVDPLNGYEEVNADKLLTAVNTIYGPSLLLIRKDKLHAK
jgi:hypothetical protein